MALPLRIAESEMPRAKRILVAIDEFRRCRRLIEYAAALAGGGRDFTVCLFHAVGPMPPQLLETPGAEGAAEEERVQERQARAQEEWLGETRSQLEPQFESERSRLIAAGIPGDAIVTRLVVLNQRGDLVQEIVKAACETRCGTILVGRNSYPWLKEQFHSHVSEKLMDEVKDAAICVLSDSSS